MPSDPLTRPKRRQGRSISSFKLARDRRVAKRQNRIVKVAALGILTAVGLLALLLVASIVLPPRSQDPPPTALVRLISTDVTAIARAVGPAYDFLDLGLKADRDRVALTIEVRGGGRSLLVIDEGNSKLCWALSVIAHGSRLARYEVTERPGAPSWCAQYRDVVIDFKDVRRSGAYDWSLVKFPAWEMELQQSAPVGQTSRTFVEPPIEEVKTIVDFSGEMRRLAQIDSRDQQEFSIVDNQSTCEVHGLAGFTPSRWDCGATLVWYESESNARQNIWIAQSPASSSRFTSESYFQRRDVTYIVLGGLISIFVTVAVDGLSRTLKPQQRRWRKRRGI